MRQKFLQLFFTIFKICSQFRSNANIVVNFQENPNRSEWLRPFVEAKSP